MTKTISVDGDALRSALVRAVMARLRDVSTYTYDPQNPPPAQWNDWSSGRKIRYCATSRVTVTSDLSDPARPVITLDVLIGRQAM